MAWKPKEKELTREEAVALARAEAAPYWHNSGPLVVGIRHEGRPLAMPLDDGFAAKVWLVYFIDPAEYSGIEALHYAAEFNRRYAYLQVHPLVVLRTAFRALTDAKVVENYLRANQLQYPVALDPEGTLAAGFGVQATPSVLLVDRGTTRALRTGVKWMDGFEAELQRFLRTDDPGLALPNRYEEAPGRVRDRLKLDFGRGHGAAFPKPGFGAPTAQGFATGLFTGEQRAPGELQLSLTGRWIQDGDRIATQDPTAEISLRSPSAAFGLIAQSLAKVREDAHITFEVNGKPAFDVFGDEDLHFDDEGHALIRADLPRLYLALRALPPRERDLTLRFPHANRAPVALYGFRFGD
jgi:hypothetical protein